MLDLISTESGQPLVPSIPVQTVSMATAAMLLSLLGQEKGTLKAPAAWTGGLGLAYTLGLRSSKGKLLVPT